MQNGNEFSLSGPENPETTRIGWPTASLTHRVGGPTSNPAIATKSPPLELAHRRALQSHGQSARLRMEASGSGHKPDLSGLLEAATPLAYGQSHRWGEGGVQAEGRTAQPSRTSFYKGFMELGVHLGNKATAQSKTGRCPGPPTTLAGAQDRVQCGRSTPGPWAAQVCVTHRLSGHSLASTGRLCPHGRRVPRRQGKGRADGTPAPGTGPSCHSLGQALPVPRAAREFGVSSKCHQPHKKSKILLGRMLGYLFFSLFSSLLACSKVPCMCPDGSDWKKMQS